MKSFVFSIPLLFCLAFLPQSNTALDDEKIQAAVETIVNHYPAQQNKTDISYQLVDSGNSSGDAVRLQISWKNDKSNAWIRGALTLHSDACSFEFQVEATAPSINAGNILKAHQCGKEHSKGMGVGRRFRPNAKQ